MGLSPMRLRLQFVLAAICMVSCRANQDCVLDDDEALILLQGHVHLKSQHSADRQDEADHKVKSTSLHASNASLRTIRSQFSHTRLQALLEVSSGYFSFFPASLSLADGKDTPPTNATMADTRFILKLSAGVYGFMGCLWLLLWHSCGEGNEKPYLKTMLLAATWSSMSIGMNVLNKSLSTQLESPCLIASTQMAIAVVVLLCTTLPQQRKALENPQQLKVWLVVPLLFSSMLISSFYTFEYISLSLLTVVRNLAPLVSLPLETMLMSPESKPTIGVVASVLVMLMGAIVYCGGINEVSTLGLSFAALNCVMCICDRLTQRRLLTRECKEMPLAACTVMNNLLGLFPTLAVAVATGEFQHAAANIAVWQDPEVYVLLALSGVIGIGICYCGLACQREITATSFLVLQNTAKFGVVGTGIVIFSDPIQSPTVALGLLLSLGGSALYGKAQLDQKNEKR